MGEVLTRYVIQRADKRYAWIKGEDVVWLREYGQEFLTYADALTTINRAKQQRMRYKQYSPERKVLSRIVMLERHYELVNQRQVVSYQD